MEKKSIKVPLLVVILIFALIAIAVLGCIVFLQNKKIKEVDNKVDNKIENVIENEVEEPKNETKNKTKEPKDEYAIDTTSEDIEYMEYDSEASGIYGLYVTEAIDNKDGTYTLRGVEVTDYNFDRDTLEDIEKEGKMTIDGVEYELVEPDEGNSETQYRLEDEDGLALYEIIMEEDNLFKVIRLAQITTVYQFAEGYAEITVPEDMEIERDMQESTTVKERFENFKTKKLQLTKEEIRDTIIHDNETTYNFEINSNGKVTSIMELLMGV